MSEIKLLNVSKAYGEKKVIKGMDITVRDGELISLLGPSGCGKTTLLKIIAGLEEPTEGRVFLDGKDVTDMEASSRNAVIIFQDYRLFPHLTVFENIEFGLAVRKMDKSKRTILVKEMIELMQLKGTEKSYPSQISGGQKQRAALARALIFKPKVLLLDEPFSNLDTALRENMREFVSGLHKELKFTAVLVTHDKEEAFMMSEKAAVLINGELQQFDMPAEIYRKPKTKELAEFLGEANFISGVIVNGFFESSLGYFKTFVTDKENAHLMLRYDQIELTRDKTGIACEILDKRFAGREVHYKVKVDDELILKLASRHNDFSIGQRADICVKVKEPVVY